MKTYEQIMGKYKRTEQPQIEKELKADVRTHEGWLREREVEKHAEDPIKRARRERHAAIAMAIATRGKARYTEMQKETRIPDKTLSWDLKELVRTQKLKRRQDNSKWPPEVYYELTKKGYEDKKFQRALFAHREIYSLFQNSVFGPDHTRYEDPLVIAKNMISSTHLAALLILKLMVEDKAKRIPFELTNKARVDLTDYEDIREILLPHLTHAIDTHLGLYLREIWIDEDAGELIEEPIEAATRRASILLKAIDETLNTEVERKRLEYLYEWWHAEKKRWIERLAPRPYTEQGNSHGAG